MTTDAKNEMATMLAEQMRAAPPAPANGTSQDAAPQDEPEGPLPVRNIERPSPPARGATPRRSGKTSNKVRDFVGAEERVTIYKVGDTGKEEWCQEYAIGEVNRATSIESFIRTYLVPHHDYGEYAVYSGKPGTPKDKLHYHGTVTIRKPREEAAPTREITSLKEILRTSLELEDRAKEEGRGIVSQLRELAEFQEKFNGGKGDPTLAFLMMMMQNQAREGRSIDPLVMKVVDRLEQLEHRLAEAERRKPEPMPPMAPPPPPPPPPDPLAGIKPLLEGIMTTQRTVMEAMIAQQSKPVEPQRDILKELSVIKELFGGDRKEMGPHEWLAIIKELRGEVDASCQQTGPKSFEEQVAELRKAKSALGELQQEFGAPHQGSSFWDLAIALLQGGSPIAQQVAEGVREAVGGGSGAAREQEEGARKPELVIPEEFEEIGARMDQAAKEDDIMELVKSTVLGLQVLFRAKGFQRYVGRILKLAEKNEKRLCLRRLGELLLGLHEAGSIEDKETVRKVIQAFKDHWLVICHNIGFKHDRDPDVGPTPETKDRTKQREMERRRGKQVPPVPEDPKLGKGKDAKPDPEPAIELEDDDDEVEMPKEDPDDDGPEERMSIDDIRALAERRGVPGPDVEKHPEGYEGECYCQTCVSYADPAED